MKVNVKKTAVEVTLTITEEEANYLAALTGATTDALCGYQIYDALSEAGFEGNGFHVTGSPRVTRPND